MSIRRGSLRDVLLVALVGVNALLAIALVLISRSPNQALAQAAGASSKYCAVAGEVQDQFDGLYLIDMDARLLHAFAFDRTRRMLQHVEYRDLEADFRNNRD